MEWALKLGILLNLLRLGQFNDFFSNDINEDILTMKEFVLWPKGTIPFYINSKQFDQQQQTTIMSALATFAFKTCLKFAPLLAPPKDDQHVMVFENPDGEKKCTISTTGHSIDEPHRIRVGYHCLEAPWVDLLIMRALGFPLEHNRASRNLYIDVQQENIETGAIELFAKQPKLPVELQNLPYDYNSVLHFGPRDYSKNGHRTIIFKNPNLQQSRIGLSPLDLRKIDLVYGPQCRERDREEKIELCKKYPGVARKKRDVTYDTVQNLRVNRNIKPPDSTPDLLPAVLVDLGVHKEVQEIVDKIYEVTEIALNHAREKHCNKTKPILRTTEEVKASNKSDILGTINHITEYIKTMVDNALVNITEFCDTSENLEKYVRAGCPFFDKRDCPQTYRSTKSGPVKYSTQHRPLIRQSTKHQGQQGNRNKFIPWRSGNQTEPSNETTTEPVKARRKRDVENENANKEEDKDSTNKEAEEGKEEKAEVDKAKTENTVEDKAEQVKVEVDKDGVVKDIKNDKVENSKSEKDNSPVKENSKAESFKDNLDNSSLAQLKRIEETIKKVAKVFKAHSLNENKTHLRARYTTVISSKSRFDANYRASNDVSKNRGKRSAPDTTDTPKNINNSTSNLTESLDKSSPPESKVTETNSSMVSETVTKPSVTMESSKIDELSSSITEKPSTVSIGATNVSNTPTARYFRRFRMKRVKTKKQENEDNDSNVSLDNNPKIYNDEEEPVEKYKGKREKKERYKKRPADSEEGKDYDREVPKTVKLSKQNQEFYEDRKWPGGVVRYIIKEDPSFNIQDMRDRLKEVNDILKTKTCVRIQELSEVETHKYKDYLVLDNSPDYVTGRVGKRQNFGVLELFRGGQHRQHAAMMVMAMLGFYFEVSRHDRDKYIRVHQRHVRPDKLHHFEKLRSDATLPLPYDYKSATHPAWQFWRQIGRTGISTVATYKAKDPDGSVMKSLGQNEELLSDLDIVKINSVYGVKCFKRH